MSTAETDAAPHGQASKRRLGAIVLLTLALSFVIAIDLVPWLRGPEGQFEWRWGYHVFSLQPLRLILVAFTIALLGTWYWFARRRARVSGWLLAALIPIGLAFQVGVLSTGAKGLELVARVLNPGYFGYYLPATQVTDMPHLLDTWAEFQATTKHPRLQTHPPGIVAFEWLVYKATQAVPALTDLSEPLVTPRLASLPEWASLYDLSAITGAMFVSLLIPAMATAAVVPLFLLARTGFGEEVGRRAALLYLLAPTVTLFQPKIDEVFTLVSIVTFLLTTLGARDDRLLMVYLSGLVCSIGLFMSFGMLPLMAINGLFLLGAALATWQETVGDALPKLARLVTSFVLGILTVQLLTMFVFGFEPVESFLVMLRGRATWNYGRSYWLSLIYTPYDILLFVGTPAAMLLVGRVAWLYTGLRRGEWRQGVAAVDWLLLSTLVILLASMLTGAERAENARTYLFLVPVIALFAAAESERVAITGRAFLGLAALTLVQLVVYQAVLEVFL